MLSDVLRKWSCFVVEPMELYRHMFRLGEHFIQQDGEEPGQYKANPLIIGKSKGRMHRKIMFEDTFEDTLREFCGYDWAFMSGCTYFGRTNNAEHQSRLYAFIFDIDGVDEVTLNRLLNGMRAPESAGLIYPLPQYIVLSGHGIHLYYILEEPLELFPNIKTQAKELKYELTKILWNGNTSNDKHVQYQGINQAFRVPGSKTKAGAELKVCQAFYVSGSPYYTDIEELNKYVSPVYKCVRTIKFAPQVSLDYARSSFPEWYERVVINKDKTKKHWQVKEDLYRWFLQRLKYDAVTYGHRYFCVMALAIFAVKCGIFDKKRVQKDAESLIERFCQIKPDQPFTKTDIKSALECLDARYITFPRKDLERLTGLSMPANKRNGRKQDQHLKLARFARDLNYEEENGWRKNAGRPKGSPNKTHPKQLLVQAYAGSHPKATQREIAKALGISKTTVNKWLNCKQN